MGEPRQRLLWDYERADGYDVAKEPDPSPFVEPATALHAEIDRLSAVEIARRLEALGLTSRDICPELALFMHARREGVIILLSLVARGKIRTDGARRKQARSILDRSKGLHPFGLAVETDDLRVPPRKRSYRKMNGIINGLRVHVDVLRQLTEGSRIYYQELLGEIIAGDAGTMKEARLRHAERLPLRLPERAAEAV